MNGRSRMHAGAAAVLAAALLYSAGAPAQEPIDAVPASGASTIATLESRRTAADSDTALPADVKSRVLDLYTRAIDERAIARDVRAEIAALTQLLAQAGARIEALQRTPDVQPADPTEIARQATRLSPEELAARVRDREQALATARQALTAREQELTALTALGPTLSAENAQRQAALRALRESAQAPPPDAELPSARDARIAYEEARVARLQAEIERADLQLANYETLLRLATQERDATAREEPRLDTEREVLVHELEARRTEAARAAREDAVLTEAASASLPPAIAALAADNAKLRTELEKITIDSGRVAEQLRATERRVSELDTELASIRERVSAVGATDAVGRLLRRRLQYLLAASAGQHKVGASENEIVRATDRRIDLDEQRRELTDLQASAEKVLGAVDEAGGATLDAAALRAQTNALLRAKRTTIEALQQAYGRYLTQLTSQLAAQRQFDVTAQTMRAFIRQELLWIRSLPPLTAADLTHLPATLAGMFDPASWRGVLADIADGARSRPLFAAGAALAVLVLIALRMRARRRLGEIAQLTGRMRTDAFRHTLIALVLTALLASGLPLAIAYFGWLAGAGENASPFSRSISSTLGAVASLLVIFSAARWVLHPVGLAKEHFGWSEPLRATLRAELRWLMPVTALCVAFTLYAVRDGAVEARLGLGRPAIIAFCLALAAFLWRLFGSRSRITALMRKRVPGGLYMRTWRAWFTFALAVPLGIAAGAAAGYVYTAAVTLNLLIRTAWLVLGVWVLRDVMLRWFRIAERRLRLEQALAQRDEARSERGRQGRSVDVDPEAVEIEIPPVDFRELGDQGRSVVQAVVLVGILFSLWTLWSDLLPALNVLDRLHPLPLTRLSLVDGVERQVAVTGTDLVMALVVLAGTLFASHNLSGLLGFTIFNRLDMDAGACYAVVTLSQYALIATGVLFAVSTLGMQWEKLQWLVAALALGLGFGLQEIVANFVSGIILLLERPIRVGDIVTVGDATGTVARIQIRATTILDLDRKELVVPNKEFVTGRLLNWTLSNRIVRMIIPVGVAYGSDARAARELMLEAARETEHVLTDPKPIVVFDAFGDNALALELRVYLPSMENWLNTRTALHDVIYHKFQQAGIEISFPQRDVHLDTTAPLDIRLHRGAPEPEPKPEPPRSA